MEKITRPPRKPVGVRRILNMNDIHLLHKRVPTWHIVDVLQEILVSCENTLDALYIAGDLFDDSRHLRQEDSQEAVGFLTWLLRWSKDTDTAVRIVEGTPSHDHGQSKIVEALNISIGADCLYLPGIGIFYDPALDATVGWVQDEYKAGGGNEINAAATEAEMAELMATRGLEQLDFIFMHGCFTFQLPIESPRSFNESFWLPRVKHLIYIGHDHRKKEHDKIRVVGSPERLAQGEEEDKGVAIVDFTETVCRDYFLVNPRACPQRKVKAQEDYDAQLAACLSALEYIDNHPSSVIGRFEVEYYAGSPLAEHVNRWKKEYAFHISGERVRSSEEDELLVKSFSDDAPVFEMPTQENIERLILEELTSVKYDPDVVTTIIRNVA
ncbi:hypothetical protein pEaSNUABM29_00134 [Erwinia phage pEa_SNUABM_29]|nr:hypothetical protein pEaSNUABM29_00134 [Erwinia phage pEa_SNUABM_29]